MTANHISEASILPQVTDSAQSSATGFTSGPHERLSQHQQATEGSV